MNTDSEEHDRLHAEAVGKLTALTAVLGRLLARREFASLLIEIPEGDLRASSVLKRATRAAVFTTYLSALCFVSRTSNHSV